MSDYKSKVGVEDLEIGIGTFDRRTSTGETLTLTKIHIGDTGDAAPTSGTYPRGFVRWNTAPEAGGNVGWVCVTAGTPGTWKEFGPING